MIDSLPGFPDGVSLAKDGNFWITLVAPNQSFIKVLPYRSAPPYISLILCLQVLLIRSSTAVTNCHKLSRAWHGVFDSYAAPTELA